MDKHHEFEAEENILFRKFLAQKYCRLLEYKFSHCLFEQRSLFLFDIAFQRRRRIRDEEVQCRQRYDKGDYWYSKMWKIRLGQQ